jgi:hypothetical protein
LEDVVLRGEAFLEFLGSSVKYRWAEPDGGQVWAGELGPFLVLRDIFKAVAYSPIDHPEGFVKDQFNPVLEKTEGKINEEVKAEKGGGISHIRGVGNIMEGF